MLLRAYRLKLKQRMKALRIYTTTLNYDQNVPDKTRRIASAIKMHGLGYELIDLVSKVT